MQIGSSYVCACWGAGPDFQVNQLAVRPLPCLFPQMAVVSKTCCISQPLSLSSQLTSIASWLIWSLVEWVNPSHACCQGHCSGERYKCCLWPAYRVLLGPAGPAFPLHGCDLLFHFRGSQNCLFSRFLVLGSLLRTDTSWRSPWSYPASVLEHPVQSTIESRELSHKQLSARDVLCFSDARRSKFPCLLKCHSPSSGQQVHKPV